MLQNYPVICFFKVRDSEQRANIKLIQIIKPISMIFKQLNRLQQIDQLIRQKRTGNAEEFASKLNMSRRQVYNYINELRTLGIEVEYNRNIRSYSYKKKYKLFINIEFSDLNDKELIKIYGGIKCDTHFFNQYL